MKVEFRESEHTYWLGDRKLISVTRLLQKHGLATNYSAVDAGVLHKAAQRGATIHKEIEDYIKTGAAGFTREFMEFLDLCDELGFIPEQSEIVLPCKDIAPDDADNYIFAGTADIIGRTEKGLTLIDVKSTKSFDRRYCTWQLSLYEWLYGEKFAEIYVFHLGETSKAIEIERIPEREIGRLLECERKGEIYQEPGLVAPSELIASVMSAERALVYAEAEKKAAEERAKTYRQKLYELMTEQGIDSWETLDKSMLVSRVAPYNKTTIDSKKLRADLPEIAKKYSKVSGVEGYAKITIREG